MVPPGGALPGAGAAVCVISPWPDRLGADGVPEALVPLAQPTLLAVGRFQAMQLEANGRVLWSHQATVDQPLEGPIPWPLAPLQPGQVLWWRLQPLGAAAGDFASLRLRAAAADRTRQQQLQTLARNPDRWLAAVNQALRTQQPALAWALLFASEGPPSAALNALRREVYHLACQPTAAG